MTSVQYTQTPLRIFPLALLHDGLFSCSVNCCLQVKSALTRDKKDKRVVARATVSLKQLVSGGCFVN